MKSFYNLLLCYFAIVNSLLSQDGNTPTNFQIDAAASIWKFVGVLPSCESNELTIAK